MTLIAWLETMSLERGNFQYAETEFCSGLLWPSQFNASFPIARPTHFFGKVKKKIRITCKEASTFNLQAHELVLLTPIVLKCQFDENRHLFFQHFLTQNS